jgi:hypothetical protein
MSVRTVAPSSNVANLLVVLVMALTVLPAYHRGRLPVSHEGDNAEARARFEISSAHAFDRPGAWWLGAAGGRQPAAAMA